MIQFFSSSPKEDKTQLEVEASKANADLDCEVADRTEVLKMFQNIMLKSWGLI